MDRTNVLEQVAAELTHIPRWPAEHQGMLRAIYRLFRENDLAAAKTGGAGAVLLRSIAAIRRDYPGAGFEYDPAFFHGRPG
jgi:hypothetical protein